MAGLGDLNMQNPLWVTFLFYAAVLGLKTLMMSFATGRHRMTKKIFANAEDARDLHGQVKMDDPDVERVRRAHLNDLENVVPFLILCPLYLSTAPGVWLATNLIRTFTAARIAHTFVYLNVVPQPARGIAFAVGMAVNICMCGNIIIATM